MTFAEDAPAKSLAITGVTVALVPLDTSRE